MCCTNTANVANNKANVTPADTTRRATNGAMPIGQMHQAMTSGMPQRQMQGRSQTRGMPRGEMPSGISGGMPAGNMRATESRRSMPTGHMRVPAAEVMPRGDMASMPGTPDHATGNGSARAPSSRRSHSA
jgi:hypothetical protein